MENEKISQLIKRMENEKILNNHKKINIPFLMKPTYNSIIPLNLFIFWHTKDLPPNMNENYTLLKLQNPEFTHYLFDENDGREFINNNFNKDVVYAYDNLTPKAYKADLWRLCVLYINGGIYLDIKFKCTNNFKLIALTEKEFFTRDRNPIDVYNGLIICKQKNDVLLKSIEQIVHNVKNKFYGSNSLAPTGPHLLGKNFTQEEKNNMELCFDYTQIENVFGDYYILYNNTIVLNFFKEYRHEKSSPHYSIYWVNNNIYL
jgi:mannosyltransferase OCH1-like enzyme